MAYCIILQVMSHIHMAWRSHALWLYTHDYMCQQANLIWCPECKQWKPWAWRLHMGRSKWSSTDKQQENTHSRSTDSISWTLMNVQRTDFPFHFWAPSSPCSRCLPWDTVPLTFQHLALLLLHADWGKTPTPVLKTTCKVKSEDAKSSTKKDALPT